IKAGKLGYPRTNLAVPGPVGGPCLEKDPHILAETMRELGVEPHIAMAARGVNERQPQECVNYIAQAVAERGAKVTKVSLLGLAFKGRPVTDDLRGTMARPILNALRHEFPSADFCGYDNAVADADIAEFGLRPAPTLEDAFAAADLVVIANNHPMFSSMPIIGLAGEMREPGLIYDFWNSFDSRDLALPAGVRYVSLGAHGLAQRMD
ncbi:MAG: nucleotide sugar dehydrogenase, partial [Rhodospirillaceae bacterium]|nr:nucleotide sugar dehydrogenase [Rhodospirillaceae bacterium]